MPRPADPHIKNTAHLLIVYEAMTTNEALEQSGVKNIEKMDRASRQNYQQLVRRMKTRIKAKAAKELELKKSKEKEKERVRGSVTSVARSTSVVTPTPPRRSISARNMSIGRGNSELNITVNLDDLNSSSKDLAGFRLTSNQKLRKAGTEVLKKRRIDLAYTEAVSTYQQLGIPTVGKEKGKSLQSVCDEFGEKYGVAIAPSTVCQYSKLWNGFQGKNLGRRGGPAGYFRNVKIYNAMKGAWMSALAIQQNNKETEVKATEWKSILAEFLGNSGNGKSAGVNLYNRLARDCATMLTATKEYFVELRRQIWTTDKNLDAWFDNWKKFCVEKGFATDDPELDVNGNVVSEITFLPGMAERIVNLDETPVTLDDDGKKGGRPSSVLSTKGIPRTGTAKYKGDSTGTAILAVNAAGGVTFHMQLPSIAKVDNQRCPLSYLLGLPKGRGKFGFGTFKQDIPFTFGINEKGGMDSIEFRKYLFANIVPLYPDAEDIPGKRVIIKCDGGPGRLDWFTLLELRMKGFYLYPTVPNAMHVMQECDILFGLFKTLVRENIQSLMTERIASSRPARLSKEDLGVILNGRKGTNTIPELKSPFP